ncbi:alpha/beta fold hydrolase [Agrococcus sp. ARC_14]|uniref:alpha/beta hydrolase n=1 Tax=Agrococcus sp. ARC_14 TaxID=2919927 RepID=UPI001F0703CD|nr:alpha/beta fold hydrolase [Agrococcus sp. ARC_14]MCH1883783.1 alpha/beta hydrolase [Agrococcus sp. ARC_14]
MTEGTTHVTTEHGGALAETRLRVPVDGGELVATVWNADAAGIPVVAIHGITANHRSFSPLVARLDVPVLAVDLRGRGGSRALPGPYGLEQHAEDLAAAIRAAGFGRARIVGHSMGGFVGVRLAHAHPELVASLVLVDGGVPLRPVPESSGLTPADVLGPAIERLGMTFPSHAAYRDYWRAHPAFGPYWSAAIEEYVDYDLVSVDGALRPSAIPDAVLTNLVELDGRAGYLEALASLTVPMALLRSPRGLFDETPGLYDDEWLATWTSRLPALAVTDVEHTNHYTILMGQGVGAVAEAVALLAPAEEKEAR